MCFLLTTASPVATAFIVAFMTVESSERYYFMGISFMAFAAILSFECLRKGMTADCVAAEDERFLDTGVKCEQKETIGSYSIWVLDNNY